MNKFTVTPWEVSGDIDYDKLIKEFGTEKITDSLLKRIEKHTGELHWLLRRKIFFSHRDLKWILDNYEKGNKFFLYTGRAPSGLTHIGHLVPWMFSRWLQEKFKVEMWFQIPDDEKFLFKPKLTLEDTKHYAYDNILDIIALGFDPKKTKIFLDTEYAKVMYPLALQISKKITLSTAKAVFGFKNNMNIGAIFYTSMQTVPAILPSVLKKKNIPCLIPYAIDQDAHFRVSRDVLPKLGYYKPAAIHCRFLSGLSGPHGKMSSSDPKDINTIFATDSAKTVEHKIKKYAFSGGQPTIKEHMEKGGNPDVDVSYQYLTFLEPSDKKLKKIYEDYKSGAMLTSELKEICIETLNKFLKNHQKKRELAKKNIEKFMLRA